MSEFRDRLIEGKAEQRVFEKLVEEIRAMGLIKEHGKQRSDSIAMLVKVRRLSRIEMVVETLRLAVAAWVDVKREWCEEIIPPSWDDRYGERFVILMPSVLGPLSAYLKSLYGHCHGISFIDSTALMVCDNHRIHNHKVFAGLAQRGKRSMGWFYGFKLHLVINDCGELLACQITPGNVDDREPVPTLSRRLFGKLIADRGYISQALFEQLLDTFGVQLITKLRKNMKNRLLPLIDKLLLRKRALIESAVDQLKNISQIEHTRHRSPVNCFINIIAGLIAYCHQPKKPSLNLFPNALLLAEPISTLT